MLTQEVMVPPQLQNQTKGLLGNFDGDGTNDFIFRNGSVISGNSSERELFPFAQSCKFCNLFYMWLFRMQ